MININLNGTIYFARLAVAFLKENHTFDPKTSTPESIVSSKSITLVSSVAGFKESPGLFAYSAAKHGVVGLMRALRPFAAPLYGLRVNVICASTIRVFHCPVISSSTCFQLYHRYCPPLFYRSVNTILPVVSISSSTNLYCRYNLLSCRV